MSFVKFNRESENLNIRHYALPIQKDFFLPHKLENNELYNSKVNSANACYSYPEEKHLAQNKLSRLYDRLKSQNNNPLKVISEELQIKNSRNLVNIVDCYHHVFALSSTLEAEYKISIVLENQLTNTGSFLFNPACTTKKIKDVGNYKVVIKGFK